MYCERAWDSSKPLYVASAMNTSMLSNSFTRHHLKTIGELGASLLPPITKKLVYGDYGNGAISEPSVIYKTVRFSFNVHLQAIPFKIIFFFKYTVYNFYYTYFKYDNIRNTIKKCIYQKNKVIAAQILSYRGDFNRHNFHCSGSKTATNTLYLLCATTIFRSGFSNYYKS
ncbi:putative phosphopantothenoylcysteine decarboxylase [Dendrobium catenatum]|uniref:Putative phosphopantothenoylcysteine decarboxylase n=1 Tax=Dendrobium catenatum TaxID=906689 RepID=A0A2I0XFB5_9ASPA|nr:putative phosphopantothenoylcysteine decarboxylase [Dendrobium catenatum]